MKTNTNSDMHSAEIPRTVSDEYPKTTAAFAKNKTERDVGTDLTPLFLARINRKAA